MRKFAFARLVAILAAICVVQTGCAGTSTAHRVIPTAAIAGTPTPLPRDIRTELLSQNNYKINLLLSNPDKVKDSVQWANRQGLIDNYIHTDIAIIKIDNNIMGRTLPDAHVGTNTNIYTNSPDQGFAVVGVVAGVITRDNVNYQIVLLPEGNPYTQAWYGLLLGPMNISTPAHVIGNNGSSMSGGSARVNDVFPQDVGNLETFVFYNKPYNNKAISQDEINSYNEYLKWNPTSSGPEPSFVIRGSEFNQTTLTGKDPLRYIYMISYN